MRRGHEEGTEAHSIVGDRGRSGLKGYLGFGAWCGWILWFSLGIAWVFVVWVGVAKNEDWARKYEDLKWRKVTLQDRIDPWRFKGIDWVCMEEAAGVAGVPLEVMVGGRYAENGGKGYEYGYRGQSPGVTGKYEPECWQYGEYARRMNGLAWAWIISDKKRWKEASEWMAGKYTGRKGPELREYAKVLRSGDEKLSPP